MTKPTTKRPSARRREPKPRWQDVVRTAVGALVEHLRQPPTEQRMTITAFADIKPHATPLGELSLPLSESANWSMDALAKFPTAVRFDVTGRDGYSHEVFDVRNGRVYEVPTLDEMRFEDNRPRA